MKTELQMDGWTWNEAYAQYERGDFRVVKHENEFGREYYRLQIRCDENPKLDRSAPIESNKLEHLDIICRTFVAVYKEQYNVELKY